LGGDPWRPPRGNARLLVLRVRCHALAEFLFVPIVFLVASSAFAAGPSDDPAATPPVVVLRGSSAPPTPWYTPPSSPPTDVDVGNEPYTLPYDGQPYYYLPDANFVRPRFVRPQRVVPHPVVPDDRPAAAQFYLR
jgi:hypothetical protein